MRVMVVHPGPEFSVSDVYTGLCAGLRANGVDVVEYPLNRAITLYRTLVGLGQLHEAQITGEADPISMAAFPIIAMAAWHDVEALIAVTGNYLHFTVVKTIEKLGGKTAIVCTESPYITSRRERYDASHYEHVFTNERCAVPLFTWNKSVHYLPHAYNPAVHRPGPAESDFAHDAFFVGTAFEERKQLFDAVDWSGVDFACLGTLWDGCRDEMTILRRVVDNTDTARYYRSAAININHHRTTGVYGENEHIPVGAAESLGPRTYEIAACGGFQLCDDTRPELFEVFGDTVPTYHDSASLERAVRYWLKHPDERQRLAAAQHEAVQPHSWTERAKQILEVVI